MQNTSNPRVMVVEDVPAIRQLIVAALRAGGIEVVATARNGEEAIDLARGAKPELIILDIVMPVVAGYEALPVLRREHPEALIIMLSSTSERSLILDCQRNGANGFILKRENLEEILADRIKAFWDSRAGTGTA